MQKYVAGEEVRVDDFGKKKLWVVDYSDDGKMVVGDVLGNCIKVAEDCVSPAVSEYQSGKTTTLFSDLIWFVRTGQIILEEPIALELEEKCHGMY